MMRFSFERFSAYFIKETKQMTRDPSTLLIAFVLPLILIFLFGYGVSLDAKNVPLGLLLEDTSPTARSLENSFLGTPYFKVKTGYNRAQMEEDLTSAQLRGIVVIRQDFAKNVLGGKVAPVQILMDGSEPNTARFVLNYATGVINNWGVQQAIQKKNNFMTPIIPDSRVWYNPDLNSRYVLLPGSIAIIMSMIGILLTALVVAREWERGTMEAILSTPIRIPEMLFGKLIPYFLLGLGSMVLCWALSVFLFNVPFRGSFFVLTLSTSVFLLAALSMGLLISTLTRNQFVSSQISIMVGFLPAFILSGFIFEINSMPWPIQFLTYIFPPRYYVTILQSNFLSGTIWPLMLPSLGIMLLIAGLLFTVTAQFTAKRLD